MREPRVVSASTAEEQQREQQRGVGITPLAEDVLDEHDRFAPPTVRRQ